MGVPMLRCAGLLRAGIDLRYEDRKLYAAVQATGFGRTATCYAAFTRVFCPGGLKG